MEKKINVLLAEDDDNLGLLLHSFLKSKGYQVELTRSGKQAFERFNQTSFDFCIFDVMMPEMDGFTLGKAIREIDKKVPILFLTAKLMKEDKLDAFELGADDYITKPFSMEELLARIKAILRRTDATKNSEDDLFMIGKIKFDAQSRLLYTTGDPIKLTTKENQLLKLLCKNQNETLNRQVILKAIWEDDNYFNGRSMDVYIAKLRKLLREDERVEIMNVHGKGFQLIIK